MLQGYTVLLILVSLHLAAGRSPVFTRSVAETRSNDALLLKNAKTNSTEIEPSLSNANKAQQNGHCAPDAGPWFVAEWRSSDCGGALHNLLVTDRRVFGNESFELVMPGSGVWPSRQHPYVWAPKRYTYGQLSIACYISVGTVSFRSRDFQKYYLYLWLTSGFRWQVRARSWSPIYIEWSSFLAILPFRAYREEDSHPVTSHRMRRSTLPPKG